MKKLLKSLLTKLIMAVLIGGGGLSLAPNMTDEQIRQIVVTAKRVAEEIIRQTKV